MFFLIRERFRPYSHVPGTSTPLAGSGYEVQVFPCLIRIYSLQTATPRLAGEIALGLQGPIDPFTLTNDLEKGRVTVTGCSREGWFCYHLIGDRGGKNLSFVIERAPVVGIQMAYNNHSFTLRKGERFELFGKDVSFDPYLPPHGERLCLGNHKKQEWEGMQRRLNLAELFPFWHRLGQIVPAFPLPVKKEGNLALLEACRKTLLDRNPVETEECFRQLMRVGFRSLWMPCLEDPFYQGILPNQPLQALTVSPLFLLTEGAHLIRQLFLFEEEGKIEVLPHLLPSLHCGRFTDIVLESGGIISLEWTKKTIRRLILHSSEEREVQLSFRSSVRSYRLRQSLREKGERKKNDSSVLLQKNCYYAFDNFQ